MTDRVPLPAAQLAEIAAALESLTSVLVSTTHKETILQAVAEQVVSVVPGADMASITLLAEAGPYTSASTDPRAWQIDDAQYAEGDGPCLRAARRGELVRIEVPRAEQLWPVFARAAGDLGVGSFLAAPLTIDRHAVGAVNLFSFGGHGFHEVDAQFLRLYTVVAQAAMQSVGRARVAEEQVEQLRGAMASRAVIEQAKGILMAVRGLTEDQAFQELVSQSQRSNVKLRTLARRFVAMATGRAESSTEDEPTA
ncbi:GAF and ANTAR domain-containing protein [Kutzneria buriramensis]|uniref:GAF domain-containing protein n=1 Tax=Kutzneria buriramensis TaxID=1045776 RepID=A0A3E0H7N5_9PSEU|nr:GAF and ANTAR domain-containing protein [Kutzneria buriramensis]REH39287.1 GAF domain-containing protein [Kutzneria buriramensis]